MALTPTGCLLNPGFLTAVWVHCCEIGETPLGSRLTAGTSWHLEFMLTECRTARHSELDQQGRCSQQLGTSYRQKCQPTGPADICFSHWRYNYAAIAVAKDAHTLSVQFRMSCRCRPRRARQLIHTNHIPLHECQFAMGIQQQHSNTTFDFRTLHL